MDGFKKKTIKDQVYHYIRAKILSQEFPFGSRINIDTLSCLLHVSNSPIREALIMLENDGLLTIQPNVGAKVIQFTEQSYQELNTAICGLLACTYDICRRQDLTANLSDKLRECILLQRACAAKNDCTCLTERAMAFDRCFFEAADNRYLSAVYANMESLLYLQILDNYRRHGLEIDQTIREHEAIAQAVRARDRAAVYAALEKHYDKHVQGLPD
ncbi:GntR family transcriptional regulator [Bacilliculturomica massiliensis]|uniref:GntR family transcriptional regulator n=1 Tax=Bacilliculturomica massiliensis TaxID=1917867 RepID=UPI00102F6BEF|nr:GntR family transcriptional regulator [Bacilliculturomica massiliensis]